MIETLNIAMLRRCRFFLRFHLVLPGGKNLTTRAGCAVSCAGSWKSCAPFPKSSSPVSSCDSFARPDPGDHRGGDPHHRRARQDVLRGRRERRHEARRGLRAVRRQLVRTGLVRHRAAGLPNFISYTCCGLKSMFAPRPSSARSAPAASAKPCGCRSAAATRPRRSPSSFLLFVTTDHLRRPAVRLAAQEACRRAGLRPARTCHDAMTAEQIDDHRTRYPEASTSRSWRVSPIRSAVAAVALYTDLCLVVLLHRHGHSNAATGTSPAAIWPTGCPTRCGPMSNTRPAICH
jgi:hypothetical protein